MKLWLISRDIGRDYDVYNAAVVAAETADDARTIHPDGSGTPVEPNADKWPCWCAPDDVRLIGEAVAGTKRGVILASYRAG